MKRINLLPNVITAFGLACGLFVIFRVSMTSEVSFTFLHQMTLILMLAALADLLDGAVARAFHMESDFGVLLDSLSDAISFGVAPSVLFLKSITLMPKSIYTFYAIAAAMIFTICGVFRLVRFNVKKSSSSLFIGLPIPAAAASAVAMALFFNSPTIQELWGLSSNTLSWILASIYIILGYLMISRIKFASFKKIKFSILSFQVIALSCLAASFILFGLLYYFSILLVALSWSYILFGLCLTIYRYKKKYP
jgi:CDP-diacylglycerol---serine O-phosphatidyltransferase